MDEEYKSSRVHTILGWLMEGPEYLSDRGANPNLTWYGMEQVQELILSQPWIMRNGVEGSGARAWCTNHEALIELCRREKVLSDEEADLLLAKVTLGLMEDP